MTTLREPVRPVDDVWLAMDQPDNLMIVESLMVVDGEIDQETYAGLLRERILDHFPRLRQRAAWRWLPRPGQWWEEDPDFDLDRHLQTVVLPAPGDDAALAAHVSGRLSRSLDRNHAPWEVQLIHGYRGGTAIYTRMHHAIADGTALMRVILSLADEELPLSATPGGHGSRRSLPGVGKLVATPGVAQHLAFARRPQSPLSATPQHAKRAIWADPIDVADLRPVRQAFGATVTDVLMSAVAGALRRWLLVHGDEAVVADLPTMVPVDLRGDAALASGELGNQFALVLLDLPVGLESPADRLVETTARMGRIKDSPEAWLTYGVLQAMGLVHPRVRGLATDFFARKATGVTTSVRGPDRPLHLAGHPITRMWAWAPMSADQSISTSVIGYGGQVHVGFKVDAAVVPDPEVLVAGLAAELAELTALAPRETATLPA